MSTNTPTRRFRCRLGGVPAWASHSVSSDVGESGLSCLRGGGVVRSLMSSSVVYCLVHASIVINLRSCDEHMVPPPLNAVLMVACVRWHAALCLLMNWLL